MEFAKCKCGSEAVLDWSGQSEWHGNVWQDVSICCTDPYCSRQVIIEVDGGSKDNLEARTAEKLAIETWNKLQDGIQL